MVFDWWDWPILRMIQSEIEWIYVCFIRSNEIKDEILQFSHASYVSFYQTLSTKLITRITFEIVQYNIMISSYLDNQEIDI